MLWVNTNIISGDYMHNFFKKGNTIKISISMWSFKSITSCNWLMKIAIGLPIFLIAHDLNAFQHGIVLNQLKPNNFKAGSISIYECVYYCDTMRIKRKLIMKRAQK